MQSGTSCHVPSADRRSWNVFLHDEQIRPSVSPESLTLHTHRTAGMVRPGTDPLRSVPRLPFAPLGLLRLVVTNERPTVRLAALPKSRHPVRSEETSPRTTRGSRRHQRSDAPFQRRAAFRGRLRPLGLPSSSSISMPDSLFLVRESVLHTQLLAEQRRLLSDAHAIRRFRRPVAAYSGDVRTTSMP